ncbi:MAG: hypothetical protein LBI47_01430 [Puniceicoccales bacterium]|nr:hypothetical protein [Puniceicoccales bacterium]
MIDSTYIKVYQHDTEAKGSSQAIPSPSSPFNLTTLLNEVKAWEALPCHHAYF